jgi:hypothetical protein
MSNLAIHNYKQQYPFFNSHPMGASAQCHDCNVFYSIILTPNLLWILTKITIYIKEVYLEIDLQSNYANLHASLTNILSHNIPIDFFISNPINKIKSRIIKLLPFI